MKKILFAILILSICFPDILAQPKPGKPGSFRFAFITDIHMEYNEQTMKSFDNTVKQMNLKNPAFIITGGDNVKDARRQRETYADSLYNLYIDQVKRFNARVYTGIGNHESFGVSNPKVDPSNAMYGKKMYQSRHGNTYSSFMHKGWKFLMLDNVRDVGAAYIGSISGDQMEWLREELASTNPSTPVVVVGHIPFISSMKQFQLGSLTPTPPNDGVDNSIEFFKLFAKHNLKLVLQGHFHFMEILYANNCHYIVSPDPRTGFFMFRVKRDEVEWEFVHNK